MAQVVDESNIICVVKSAGKGLCLTMQIKFPRKVSSVLFACFTLILQAFLWATVNSVLYALSLLTLVALLLWW